MYERTRTHKIYIEYGSLSFKHFYDFSPSSFITRSNKWYFLHVLSVRMHGWRPKSFTAIQWVKHIKLLSITWMHISKCNPHTTHKSMCACVIKGILVLHCHFINIIRACSSFFLFCLILYVYSRNPWFSFEIISFCIFYLHVIVFESESEKEKERKLCSGAFLHLFVLHNAWVTGLKSSMWNVHLFHIFLVGQAYILNFPTWNILSAWTDRKSVV